VNEADFQTSEVGTAFYNWLAYFRRTIEYDDVSVRALTVVVPLSKLFAHPVLGAFLGQQRWAQALKTNQLSQRVADNNFEFHSALVLISSWAAFEAYIDDVREAMPRLVNQRPLLFVDKIERQLATVGLSDTVPRDLTNNLNASKLTRNAWAHKAGKADQYFVDNCPATPFNVGDTVTVDRDALTNYLAGMVTYAIIILNRYRDQQAGLPPVENWAGNEKYQNPFKAGADALFPNPTSHDVLRLTDPALVARWASF
jgi:hypothetical protein